MIYSVDVQAMSTVELRKSKYIRIYSIVYERRVGKVFVFVLERLRRR